MRVVSIKEKEEEVELGLKDLKQDDVALVRFGGGDSLVLIHANMAIPIGSGTFWTSDVNKSDNKVIKVYPKGTKITIEV